MKKTTTQKKATKTQAKKGLQSGDVVARKDGKLVILKAKIANGIVADRKKGMSFNALEAKYKLSKQNGMCSYRIFMAMTAK